MCGAGTARRCAPSCGSGLQSSMPAVFAAWNRNDEIRRDSTSGGVFTLLAEYILESGGVVFGAAFDGSQHLRHIACFRKEELWRLRGAKYVQSDLEGVFREVRRWLRPAASAVFRHTLPGGRAVPLSGRTAGESDHLRPGVPRRALSRRVGGHGPEPWRRAGSKPLQAVRFRNKVAGWKDSHFTAVYGDGTVDTAPLFRTEYGRAFGRALFLRPSCYRCPYASMTRVGDLTLGDFWGLRPDELPDQQEKGISLLLVNTPHGSHIFDQLPLAKQPFPPERAIAGNPRLASPIPLPPERAAFFAAYALEPFDQVRREFCRLPPLPVRAAGRLLSPEVKAAIRKKLK